MKFITALTLWTMHVILPLGKRHRNGDTVSERFMAIELMSPLWPCHGGGRMYYLFLAWFILFWCATFHPVFVDNWRRIFAIPIFLASQYLRWLFRPSECWLSGISTDNCKNFFFFFQKNNAEFLVNVKPRTNNIHILRQSCPTKTLPSKTRPRET